MRCSTALISTPGAVGVGWGAAGVLWPDQVGGIFLHFYPLGAAAGYLRSHSVGVWLLVVLGSVVKVDAGLLLLTLARVLCWLNFLSLLATVRGGTFLGPSATKKRSKENASQQSVLSDPSVQTTAFGSRVVRCSLEPPTLETLLLANPYIPTLRHQYSRARTRVHGPIRPHASLRVGGLRDPRDHLGEGRT
jgi:hypothetical protein